jgi:nucleotide-binding universal stress UspA family protein
MAITRYDSLAQTPVDRPRKFVVVVDDTPECRRALRFAGGRAAHTVGGQVMLLHVMPPQDFIQWGAVQERMEAEARAEAEVLLAALADEVAAATGVRPDMVVRAGKPVDAIMGLLKEDPGIFGLVLGASASGAPGPLVDFFSGDVAGSLPCPLIIVPGGLDEDKLDALV